MPTPTASLTTAAAREFCEHIFSEIRHGDEKHTAWLSDKCSALQPTLEAVLAQVRRDALEEAAKEADRYTEFESPIGPLHTAGVRDGASHIAAWIRALPSPVKAGGETP